MKFSSIPLLFALICTFWLWAAHASLRRKEIGRGQLHSIYAWLVLLGAWGVVTSWLAVRGAYLTEGFYAFLPGLWVPLAPVMFSLTLLVLWPTFRRALWMVTEHTSPRAFFFLHAMRIAAIGSVVKAMNGILPQSFVFPIGIPDLLFGMLSLTLALFYPRGGHHARVTIVWNLLGMAVLMTAPVFMQLGLPGPLHFFKSQPDARTLYEFPMVLAPTLVVTLMFFINGWHAWVLWRSSDDRVSNASPASATTNSAAGA